MAELSEFTAMGCMYISNTKLDKYVAQGEKGMWALAEEIIKFGNNGINWGPEGAEKITQIKKLQNYDTNAVQTQIAIGISAAKAIRKWLVAHHGKSATSLVLTGKGNKKGYMTGAEWAKEIVKFQFKHKGMDKYNSSDLILQFGAKEFYGISLKKKGTGPTAKDPTIINKAFDTLLQEKSKTIDSLKEELTQIRADYFAGLLREAHKEGHIDLGDHSQIDTATNNMQLWNKAKPDKSQQEKFGGLKTGKPLTYINLKGSLISKTGKKKTYDGKDRGGNNEFREWINEKLRPEKGIADTKGLYYKMYEVINKEEYIKTFGETLVNLILKVDLLKKSVKPLTTGQLNVVNNLQDYAFGFCLCTASGKVSSKGVVTVGEGKAYEQADVLVALAHFEGKRKNNKYKMSKPQLVRGSSRLTEEERKIAIEEVAAAKVWFEISLGDVVIMDIEIRYKGSFTSQPQFFGYMTPAFAECALGGHCV
jgi:hypothetical protein